MALDFRFTTLLLQYPQKEKLRPLMTNLKPKPSTLLHSQQGRPRAFGRKERTLKS